MTVAGNYVDQWIQQAPPPHDSHMGIKLRHWRCQSQSIAACVCNRGESHRQLYRGERLEPGRQSICSVYSGRMYGGLGSIFDSNYIDGWGYAALYTWNNGPWSWTNNTCVGTTNPTPSGEPGKAQNPPTTTTGNQNFPSHSSPGCPPVPAKPSAGRAAGTEISAVPVPPPPPPPPLAITATAAKTVYM